MTEKIHETFIRVFSGREINMREDHPEKQSPKKIIAEQLFRCHGAGGCGQALPQNSFYKDLIGICIPCAEKIAFNYAAHVEDVSLISSCFETTKHMLEEARAMLPLAVWQAGYDKLVAGGKIDVGSRHFIKSMLVGTQNNPTDLAFFSDLRDRYKAWLFNELGVSADLYSNKPKSSGLP